MPSSTQSPERTAVRRLCSLFKLSDFIHGAFPGPGNTSELGRPAESVFGVLSDFHIMQCRECTE